MNETEQQVRSAIGRVTDPELGRSLDELAMVESVAVAGNAARIHIQLPTPAYPGASVLPGPSRRPHDRLATFRPMCSSRPR